MVTLVAFAPRRREQAPEAAVGTASSRRPRALGSRPHRRLHGDHVAVCVPPPAPALRKNAYFLAISCFFFAGVGGVMSAVCKATTPTSATATLLGGNSSPHDRAGGARLAAASTAITVAVCVPPPPALHKNAYFLAISCFFFAGVGGVMSAVCMAATTHLRHRHATWREHMHVLLARLASVHQDRDGMLGLAAASTAMNLQSVGQQPHQPPRGLDEIEYCYHLAISAVFFAGVAGVMAAVREGGQVAK
ncbi:hypothetical protein BDA96_03G076500 [Sorghum bicolor]|uniref:Uncharacterized protein n=1 Tax=Sorghum bicolor TaxID=4558 RepID=A0A921RC44_SORBI|nr:hypothetical protein BDA96_03G076500 [Sorghum bicolor]